jgi:hypothetical protein
MNAFVPKDAVGEWAICLLHLTRSALRVQLWMASLRFDRSHMLVARDDVAAELSAL